MLLAPLCLKAPSYASAFKSYPPYLQSIVVWVEENISKQFPSYSKFKDLKSNLETLSFEKYRVLWITLLSRI